MKFIILILFLVSCKGGDLHQPLSTANKNAVRATDTTQSIDFQSVSMILTNRCTICHKTGGQFPDWSTIEQAEKYLNIPDNAQKAFWKITKDPRGGLAMPLEGTPQSQGMTAEERRALANYFSGSKVLP